MKNITNKILILLSILLASLMSFSLNINANQKVNALSADGAIFTVEKINRIVTKDTYGLDPNSLAYDGCIETTTYTFKENDTAVILNNANLETYQSNYIIEAIKVSLKPIDDSLIIFINPTITLNGKEIDLQGNGKNTGVIKEPLNSNIIDTQPYSFTFYIDLTNIRDIDRNLVNETSGYYSINISYNVRGANGITSYSKSVKYGLYILNEIDFINANSKETNYDAYNPKDNIYYAEHEQFLDQKNVNAPHALQSFYNNNSANNNYDKNNKPIQIEPRLYNTQKVERYIISPNTKDDGLKNYYANFNYRYEVPFSTTKGEELNYFNFSNIDTVDYDGVKIDTTSSEYKKILYPQLSFDARRYNISWTFNYKTVDTYTIDTTFEILDTGIGTLSFYKTINGVRTLDSAKTIEKGLHNTYIATLEFKEIGEYSFNINYASLEYKVSDTTSTSGITTIYKAVENVIDNPVKTNLKDENNEEIYLNHSNSHLIGSVALSIYGYELYYTGVNSDGENQLQKFHNEEYITDFTYLNQDRIAKELIEQNSISQVEGTKVEVAAAHNKYYNLAHKLQGQEVDGITLPAITMGDYNLASTNQAPVEFKSLGTFTFENYTNYPYSYYIYFPYGLESNNGVEIGKIQNSTRFTKNGTYQVVLFYNYYNYKFMDENYQVQQGNNKVHSQLLVFEIANTPPSITISTTETSTPLNRGDYTNESVLVTVDKKNNSPFNIEPILICQYTDFNTNITQEIKLDQNIATISGNYTIIVKYGQGHKSSQVTEFNIDKTPITNPTIHSENDTLLNNLTNKNFYIDFDEKISGAQITTTYTYIPFEIYTIDLDNVFVNDNMEIIKNGYKLNTYYTSTPYTKNSVLTKPGLYFFTLSDEAGNLAYKYVLYDTTAPVILQHTKGEQEENEWILSKYYDNLVTDDTQLLWGTTKAVETSLSVRSLLRVILSNLKSYSNVLNLYTASISDNHEKAKYRNAIDIERFNSSFTTNEASLTMKVFAEIPIDKIEIYFSGTTEMIVNYTGSQIKTHQGITFYALQPDDKTVDKNLIAQYSPTSTRLYDILAYDSIGNHCDAKVEMNLDHSLVLIYSYSDTAIKVTENNRPVNYNYWRIYNQEVDPTNWGTNRDKIYVTFSNDIGTNYEIESLNYVYFPIDLDDINSKYFPYTLTEEMLQNANLKVDLLKNASRHSGTQGLNSKNDMITTALNCPDSQSATGLYIITRTYVAEVPENNGDTRVKTYTILVDRNQIIGIYEDVTIGEHIALNLGDTSLNNSISGLEFLIDLGSGTTIFTTNLIPIKAFIPNNKYYFGEDKYSTLAPLNLEMKIYYNPLNDTFDNTSTLIEGEYIYKEGYYKFVISDCTGYDLSTTNKNINSNEISFIFRILYSKPKGNFSQIVESANGEMTEKVISNEVTSVNSQTLSFYWLDPLTKFEAPIDASKVTVTYYSSSTNSQQTIYNGVGGIDTSVTLTTEEIIVSGKLITKYILNLDDYAQKEGKYVVHLEYIGNESSYVKQNKTMFENDIIIYVDITSPYYNAQNLVLKDHFLSQQEKNSMLESIKNKLRYEDGDTYYINFENYVFVVENDFTLASMNNDSFWLSQHDTYNAYIRKYPRDLQSSSIADGTYLQSLVKGDKYYGDRNYSTQLNFSPFLLDSNGVKYYTAIDYDKEISLITQNGSGYYEIVEVDEAGNQTIYTIFVQDKDEELFDLYYEDSKNLSFSVASKDYKINLSDDITFTTLLSKLDWFTIELKDNMNLTTKTIKKVHNKETLLTDEFNTLEEILEEINKFTTLTEVMLEKGASFTITFKHPTNKNKDLSVQYNTPGSIIEPEFKVVQTGTTRTLYVIVPRKTNLNANTEIISIEIYRAIKGSDNNYTSAPLLPFIPNYETGELTHSLPVGNGISYMFRCTDNFGRTYVIMKNVDLEEADDLIFYSNVLNHNGIDYTGGKVILKYQTQLYTAEIKLNGTLVPLNNDNFSIERNTETGICYVTIVPNNPTLNQDSLYEIYLKPVITISEDDIVQPKKFRLYTKIPDLTLYNSTGKEINYAINGSTAKDIYIYYKTDGLLFDIIVNAVLTTENGTTKTFYNLPSSYCLSEAGKYTLSISNALGAHKEYVFTKKSQTDPYFTVYDSTKSTALTLSPTKFEDTEDLVPEIIYLDWYFSNDKTKTSIIDVNEDLNITYELLKTTTYNDLVTNIYHIHTNENYTQVYNKYIAITYVDPTESLVEDCYVKNSEEATPQSIESLQEVPLLTISFVDKQIILMWTAYNTIEENVIYCNYYYNNILAGTSYDGTKGLTFIESGIYTLEFFDMAGNRHLFQANGATSHSFELVMYNEILFTVNDLSPIDNAVYNEPVIIQLQQTESFVTRSLKYTATRNNQPITLPATQDVQELTEYGYYEINIEAQVQKGKFISLNGETMPILRSKICFTIINPNQARYAFEYSGNTIFSVTKNGIDVTRAVLNGLTSASSIVLSPDLTGNGIYEIKAKQVFQGLRPDSEFTFKVWINNETPIITSNIEQGESTTKDLFIYFNPYQIHTLVGDCSIVITNGKNETIIPINPDYPGGLVNEKVEYALEKIGTYVIQLKSDTNTLSSFVIIKKEPLNPVAVIIIVLVCVTLAAGIFIFIKLRTRMRIK